MTIKKRILVAVALVLLSGFIVSASAQTSGNTTADVTFSSGTLTLVEMTSISFGSHEISSIVKTYPAMESKVSLDVRDLRGTGKGWKVTAIASDFVQGENPTLPGASINLLNGSPTSTQPASLAPSVVQNVRLDCDGRASTTIATAAVNTGLGVWTIEWNGNANENTNATLNVPGGVATVGRHVTTITWTLTDAP